jgi:Arc/MetJ-type ribon-helix-helix transcriptional regulator
MYTNDTERLFAEGGMNDEGGTVDPVSGNDVPAGSLKNEVRDDIDAKLSEGEFVVPADVVRYIGLERLMKLRDEAKAGLARMNEIGQMGNAEEVENPEALHSGEDEGFDSEIDDIMQEVEGEAMGEKKFAAGGFATPGADLLSKYNIPRTSLTNPALDVRAYKNKDGRVMYITFFNDRPSIAIPQGYSYVSSAGQLLEETKTETAKINAPSTTTIVEQGGDGGVGTGDGGATVGGSGIGTGTGIGNSPVGIAVGSIANAIESITNPNAVVSIAEDTLSVDAQGNTVSAAATAAAANAAAVAASNAADASDNGVVGSTDATAAADNSGNTSGDTGDSGDGSGDGGDGVGVGDFAKGGLVAKRTKKPTLAQKRGIASKR